MTVFLEDIECENGRTRLSDSLQLNCSAGKKLREQKSSFLGSKSSWHVSLTKHLGGHVSENIGFMRGGKICEKNVFLWLDKKVSKRIKTENSRCIKFDKLGFFDNLGFLRSRFKNILNFNGVDHTRMTQGILIKTGMGYREPGMHPRGLLTNPWAQPWDRSN